MSDRDDFFQRLRAAVHDACLRFERDLIAIRGALVASGNADVEGELEQYRKLFHDKLAEAITAKYAETRTPKDRCGPSLH